MAFTVSALGERGATTDSLLGVLAYSALAAGLVAASLLNPGKLDLMAYLFGDILVVSKADLALIWAEPARYHFCSYGVGGP